jgi:2-oxoglutarate dehydrogenase E1 component
MRNNLSVAPTESLASAPSILEHQPPRSDARERKSASDAQAQALVQAFRMLGYRSARLDPLSLNESTTIAELEPRYHGLDLDDPNAAYATDLVGAPVAIEDLLRRLRAIYCGPIALDCTHLRDTLHRRWLWQRMESRVHTAVPSALDRLGILQRLIAAETWEQYLGNAYSHHKRFSLEGCESLVPLLDAVIRRAGLHGVAELMFGMAHRGRLNVLVNVLGMPVKQLLSVLDGQPDPELDAWDLKYHLGYSTEAHTEHGPIALFLAHNPSHLESVAPVVCGMARARQDERKDLFGKRVVPILIHGDAAFSGQGVVMETLNLSQTRGYRVGGTVHVIVNNQIGFTASDPRDIRSTPYCTDIARMIDAPVLHVNADHPESVVFAAGLALDYRMQFGADIVLDLVGFRRHGHNEQDVPTLTQPWMQRHISGHPSVVALYGAELVRAGQIRSDAIEQLRADYVNSLNAQSPGSLGEIGAKSGTISRSAYRGALWQGPVDTSVPLASLQAMVRTMTDVPEGFRFHADVQEVIRGWRDAVQDAGNPVDWRLAENLAYASLLSNGYGIRVSGMDVGRGTFFHRHAVWHDQLRSKRDEGTYVPLRHVAAEQGDFDIFDSPLSEEAVLGFEYGYSVKSRHELVVWEAQYGDFVNGAQVMIDQYISTGEAKWDYKSGLVVLLPHGHEGVGPEHSCAFLGRFLQLCAQDNMRVIMPSTSAQLFHVLRRQAIVDERKPLIVMTPKSWLYGCAPSYSPLAHLTRGCFQAVLGDTLPVEPSRVTRVVITSGKLYYDLLAAKSQGDRPHFALIRMEQLYPFPATALASELNMFPHLREVAWAQEEPKNHGAWHFVRDDLAASLPAGVNLAYIGRPAAAPSAVCYAAQHLAEQRAIVAAALGD